MACEREGAEKRLGMKERRSDITKERKIRHEGKHQR